MRSRIEFSPMFVSPRNRTLKVVVLLGYGHVEPYSGWGILSETDLKEDILFHRARLRCWTRGRKRGAIGDTVVV